jgi:trans-o-hydroxybenzylidenepyruvate hydratase-aldolase
MKRQGITVDDVVGAWAILPTPARDGSDNWRASDTVDIDETVRIVDGLIEAGVDGILSLGTYGECATLMFDEKRAFLGAVTETVQRRVPFFTGSTTLNTRQTVVEVQMARDLGADGTMLGLPMWCAPSEDSALEFYRNISEASPEMAICVYANSEAFKFEFGRSFWRRVADIPRIICAKYTAVGSVLTDIALSKNRIRFMPIDGAYYHCARVDPGFLKAFWTSGALCGPRLAIKLRDEIARAVKSNDWSAARVLAERIDATYAPLFPNGSFRDFSMFNIALEKERINAAGWCKAGPARPPYHIVPPQYVENAKRSGRLWAELESELCLSKTPQVASKG